MRLVEPRHPESLRSGVQEPDAAADLAFLDQHGGRAHLALQVALATGFGSGLVVPVRPPLRHQGSEVAVLPLGQPALQRASAAAAVGGDPPQEQLPEAQHPLQSAAALTGG